MQLGQVLGRKIQEVMFMTFPKKEKEEERCMMRKQIHGQKHAKSVAINFLMKRCRKGRQSDLVRTSCYNQFHIHSYSRKGYNNIDSTVFCATLNESLVKKHPSQFDQISSVNDS